MRLKLIRVEESEDGTFGALLIEGRVFCVTLEPPDEDNKRNISNIPAGTYTCERVNSPKHGKTFEITKVPNRSHILFHSGNIVTHTKGCILLARKFGVLNKARAILNSGNTFREFLRRLNGTYEFELEIVKI